MENKAVVPSKKRGISRRDFLRMSGSIFAGSYLLAVDAERKMLSMLGNVLEQTGLTDNVLETIGDVSGKIENETNSEFRPMMQLIQEGIDNYQLQSGRKVLYTRSESYREIDYYSAVLKKISANTWKPKSLDDIKEELVKEFPDEAMSVYLESDMRISQFEDIFAKGSGINRRFEGRYKSLFDEQGKITNYDLYFYAAKLDGKKEMTEAKEYIEFVCAAMGGPVSSARILEYFLGKNEGNLNESIYDTAIFLKFMARNDPDEGYITNGVNNGKWYREKIKDEFGKTSYQTSGDANLIGKPYHSWNLVASMAFFPNGLVHIAGLYRQIYTYKEQGWEKTSADLVTLKNLKDIEEVLIKYQG
jgi:hypothetical protein